MNNIETRPLTADEEDTKRALQPLTDLRMALFAAYADTADAEPFGNTEQDKRKNILEFIDNEVLQGKPLSVFHSKHLSMLELLFCYWRELEEGGEAPVCAPPPDDLVDTA